MNLGKIKNETSGITLVALVITIIVLLILAGVTIAMVVGDNGILTRSNEAKEESKKAEEMEEIQLAVTASKMNTENAIDEEYLEGTELNRLYDKGTLVGRIKKSSGDGSSTLPWQVTGATGRVYTITEDGMVIVTKESSGGNNDEEEAEEFEEYMTDKFGEGISNTTSTMYPQTIESEYIINNWQHMSATSQSGDNGGVSYISERDSAYMYFSGGAGYTLLVSQIPIDLTYVDSIETEVVCYSNWIDSDFILGVSDNNQLTDENFVVSTSATTRGGGYNAANKEKITVDTSSLTGKYYIKAEGKKAVSNPYNTYAEFSGITINYNKDVKAKEYKIKTIDFSTQEICDLFEPYRNYNHNSGPLTISPTSNGVFSMACSRTNTYAHIETKDPIDLSRIDYIIVHCSNGCDWGVNSVMSLGIESKSSTNKGVTGQYKCEHTAYSVSGWQLVIDVSDVDGKYYLKMGLDHTSTPEEFTCWEDISSIDIYYR